MQDYANYNGQPIYIPCVLKFIFSYVSKLSYAL